uniref:DDE-1 domain-containing protein n=1 Tax=Romanomermis culicivorax TaxID=13658 RepID=A0A915JRQ4_ROMCU
MFELQMKNSYSFDSIYACDKTAVWFDMLSHSTIDVKIKVNMAVIPSGCTGLIQTGDISWNKPFKLLLTEQYNEWMANGRQEFTKAGNMKAAPLEIVCQWIVKSWDSLSIDLIKNSFHCCGIGLAVNGLEDSEIMCFKENHKCSAGKELLIEKNRQLQREIQSIRLNVEDPMLEKEEDDDFLEEKSVYLNEFEVDSDDEIITISNGHLHIRYPILYFLPGPTLTSEFLSTIDTELSCSKTFSDAVLGLVAPNCVTWIMYPFFKSLHAPLPLHSQFKRTRMACGVNNGK